MGRTLVATSDNNMTVPMKSKRLALLSASCFVTLALATLNDALACACCTNPGQRNVGTVKLDSGKLEEIQRLRFAATTQLFVGEGDAAYIKGITTPSESYELNAVWQKDQLVFAFRDKEGRSGTLSLRRPDMISIFEVDPRVDTSDGGTGPALYKEWKLTAKAAGSGVFSVGLGPSQLLTLVAQGHGNSCTSSIDFTHWSLVMQGPKANYTFFGDLVTTP
jgi:hypothetical protein